VDPSIRLRIATRIHFGLLRHFDENVDVQTLLADGDEAREALWVCEASGDRELMALARAFRGGDKTRRPPATPPEASWGREQSRFGTTGFGTTGFGQTGFGTTEFGQTGFGTVDEPDAQDSRPARASWFGKLSAVLPR
jgi:hypothetical protein